MTILTLEQLQELRKKFRELGTTPDEIANKLHKLHIYGIENNDIKCPLANYGNSLLKQNKDIKDIRCLVGLDSIQIEEIREMTSETIIWPNDQEFKALFEFVDKYDSTDAYRFLYPQEEIEAIEE